MLRRMSDRNASLAAPAHLRDALAVLVHQGHGVSRFRAYSVTKEALADHRGTSKQNENQGSAIERNARSDI